MGDLTAATRAVNRSARRIRRGLDAVPVVLGALPTVMASPPMVTVGAQNGATQIANSVLVPWTDPRFRYLGGVAVVAGTAFPDTTVCRYHQITSSVNPANMRVEFMHDGASFEFLAKALASQHYRIVVDGQPATAAQQDLGGVTGSLYLVKVDFGSAAIRRIQIEGATMYFGGVRIGQNDSIWKPHVDPGPRVMVFGDSYTEGTGAGMATMGYAQTLCTLLGWRDCWISGVGGTGYLNDAGGGGKTTFRARVAADLIAHAPDVAIVAGGINDYVGFTAAQIGTEAGLLFAQIAAALPQTTLIVTGPWDNSGNVPTANFVQTRDALRTAALANGADLFIDNIAGPLPWSGNTNNYVDQGWITGTGHVGATTGSGNADRYVGADAVHPTQAGHDHLGHRMASAVVAWRAAGAPKGATVTNGVVA